MLWGGRPRGWHFGHGPVCVALVNHWGLWRLWQPPRALLDNFLKGFLLIPAKHIDVAEVLRADMEKVFKVYGHADVGVAVLQL